MICVKPAVVGTPSIEIEMMIASLQNNFALRKWLESFYQRTDLSKHFLHASHDSFRWLRLVTG